jgi:hypothetical protein
MNQALTICIAIVFMILGGLSYTLMGRYAQYTAARGKEDAAKAERADKQEKLKSFTMRLQAAEELGKEHYAYLNAWAAHAEKRYTPGDFDLLIGKIVAANRGVVMNRGGEQNTEVTVNGVKQAGRTYSLQAVTDFQGAFGILAMLESEMEFVMIKEVRILRNPIGAAGADINLSLTLFIPVLSEQLAGFLPPPSP